MLTKIPEPLMVTKAIHKITGTVKANEQTIAVGLGEVHVSNDPDTSLACFGLGSCISLCAYDPISRVAGMAHIVLPESNHHGQIQTSTKFADIAVPHLLKEMRTQGASKSRLVVKLAGGASMLQVAGFGNLDMGAKNLKMTEKALASEGIRPSATDAGGHEGRSVWLSVDSGRVTVRSAGKEIKEL